MEIWSSSRNPGISYKFFYRVSIIQVKHVRWEIVMVTRRLKYLVLYQISDNHLEWSLHIEGFCVAQVTSCWAVWNSKQQLDCGSRSISQIRALVAPWRSRSSGKKVDRMLIGEVEVHNRYQCGLSYMLRSECSIN